MPGLSLLGVFCGQSLGLLKGSDVRGVETTKRSLHAQSTVELGGTPVHTELPVYNVFSI